MLVVATGHMQPAPDAYASFSNALIGCPLALVHLGWSLELAADELTSQAAGDPSPPWTLLPPKSDDDKKRDHCGQLPPAPSPPTPNPKRYTFPLQIGDPQRGFDALAAYFPVRPAFPSPTDLDLGLNLTTILSHYPPSTPSPGIAKPPLLPLHSHWINPESHATADAYARARNAELQVVGALMDPFAPVHSYSGILPVWEVSLPAWTWQGAMAKMKAFFHVGPVVVAGEGVPPRKMAKGGKLKEGVGAVMMSARAAEEVPQSMFEQPPRSGAEEFMWRMQRQRAEREMEERMSRDYDPMDDQRMEELAWENFNRQPRSDMEKFLWRLGNR